MNYLVVGNSAAAVGAVEGIRSLDQAGQITLLAAESEHTYSRPLISYRLAGKVNDERMSYRPGEFYAEHGVDARLGTAVASIDPKAHTVTSAEGETFKYDRLVLATGGKPFVPKIEGLETAKGVFTFTMWEDARSVDAWIEQHTVKQAVVLGGGMIGLKAAEALLARGLKVTVVELADRLLSNTFDRTASEILEQALAKRGAAVCLNSTVEKVRSSRGNIESVTLTGGRDLYAKLLVVAIGVVPNVDYLGSSGIETGRGIVVDDHMRTSAEDVYAAGDVVEAWDLLAGKKRPLPILPLAYRQGMVAGQNMAGADESYNGGMPMNSIEICDVPTISVGLTTAEGEGYEVMSTRDLQKGSYRKVVLKDDRIVGVIMIGEIDRAGIFTGLIENKVDVGAIKPLLLSEEFGLLNLDPEYRKHMVSGPGIEV